MALGRDLPNSRSQLDKSRPVKWWIANLFLSIGMAVAVSIPVALVPKAISRIQEVADFVFLKIAPWAWSSLMHSCINPFYMYVVLNLVIVTLGVKSGILRPSENENCSPLIPVHLDESKSRLVNASGKPSANEIKSSIPVDCDTVEEFKSTHSPLSKRSSSVAHQNNSPKNGCDEAKPGLSVECRIVDSSAAKEKLADCQSSGNMFFIEVSDTEGDQKNAPEDEDWGIDDLYVKSEIFIGNFYRQLKMQREESWRRIYGIYKESC
eukprot:Gb_15161 [translate_table: standard]